MVRLKMAKKKQIELTIEEKLQNACDHPEMVMEMKKKACRAASKTEFQKKLQIISMMR